MLNKVKEPKGITLVALVITIIVLLILAGVTISFTLGENGIIKKTNQATETHKKAQLEEQLNLELVGIKMDMLAGANYTLEDTANILVGTVEDGKIIIEREGYIFTIENLAITDVSLASMGISFNPNGIDGVQIINTVLIVENKNGEVNPSTLQYGWSTAKEVQPTEWTSFTSGQIVTKDITASTQVHFLWIKARDTQGNEQIKRSNQFNDVDTTNPTINGTITMNGDQTEATIEVAVTYGFSGLEKVKWQAGTKTEEGFVSEGNNLIKVDDNTYKFTVLDNDTYTIYAEGKNGKKAIITKEVTGLVIPWERNPNLQVITTDEGINVPMPLGFTQMTGEGNSITTGIVITDGTNEFVWVPCTIDGANGTVKYEKWLTIGASHTTTTDDAIPTKITSTWGQTETNQIERYKGFYIGRYEAGIPESMTAAMSSANGTNRNVSGTPVSKKNSVPWNFIDYTNSKANSEKMYNDNAYIQSGLITGEQWDTVLKWIGKDVQTNSISWGVYTGAAVTGITQYYTNYGAIWNSGTSITKGTSTNWMLKTGNTEYTKAKNIYDLAGNMWEWTNEKYSSNRVIRGRWIQFFSGGG